ANAHSRSCAAVPRACSRRAWRACTQWGRSRAASQRLRRCSCASHCRNGPSARSGSDRKRSSCSWDSPRDREGDRFRSGFVFKDEAVGRQRQELLAFPGLGHFREQVDRLFEMTGRPTLLAQRFAQGLHFVGEHFIEELRRYLAAIAERCAVIDPLPDLRATDLRRGSVFHQIVERHGTAAAEPCFDILHADAAAFAHTRLGALALVRLKQFLLADIYVLTLAGELVRAFELAE